MSELLILNSDASEKELQGLEDFNFQHPDGNFFQSRFAYEAFKQARHHEPVLIIARKNDVILGSILGIFIKENNGIKGLLSRRCIVSGGPLVANNDKHVFSSLLSEFNKNVKKRAIYTQFRNLNAIAKPEADLFKKQMFEYYPHLDIIHDLTIPLEQQWSKIHSGRRKNIRRAEKTGLIFQEISNKSGFEQSYELIKQTYKRIKLPLAGKSMFDSFFEKLVEQGVLKVFAATFNNEVISTRMVLCYNAKIYDWYAGTNDDYLDKYPNDFLPWKIFEWGTKRGLKTFVFGGAGKPDQHYGVREYKLKFGGELVEYGRFERINDSLLFTIGKLGMRLLKVVT